MDKLHAGLSNGVAFLPGDLHSVEYDGTGAWRDNAHQAFQGGGLPAPLRPSRAEVLDRHAMQMLGQFQPIKSARIPIAEDVVAG